MSSWFLHIALAFAKVISLKSISMYLASVCFSSLVYLAAKVSLDTPLNTQQLNTHRKPPKPGIASSPQTNNLTLFALTFRKPQPTIY